MGLIKRLMDKAVLPFALAAVLGGASSFWIINASAATCSSGDGQATCTGECCTATATTCLGGPCPKLPKLPNLPPNYAD